MKLAIACISLLLCLAACESSRTPAGPLPAPTPTTDDVAAIRGGTCGSNVCGPGTFCCNRSCGICAPLGGACTQQYCPPVELAAQPTTDEPATDEPATDEPACTDEPSPDLLAIGGSCGGITCGKGTWCCNASCARCVPIGMQCTQEACN